MSAQVTEQQTIRQRVPVRVDAVVGATAAVVAVAVWGFWSQLVGVELEVRGGQPIDIASVLATVLVVSVLGVALLRLLEARTANGLRTWTIIAAVVFVVSLSGPLGATTVAAALVLGSLHACVAVVLIVGLRQVRQVRRNRPEAA